jgi:hypothetical protein
MKTNTNCLPCRSALLVALLSVAAIWVIPDIANAGSIGVNVGTTTLAPTDSAGVAPFAQTHYNNVSSSVNNLTLNDDSGAATTAKLTIPTIGNGFGKQSGVPSGPDEALNSGNIVNTLDITFTLSNIPYAAYNLIVYDLGDGLGSVQSITAAGTTFFSSSLAPTGAGLLMAIPIRHSYIPNRRARTPPLRRLSAIM